MKNRVSTIIFFSSGHYSSYNNVPSSKEEEHIDQEHGSVKQFSILSYGLVRYLIKGNSTGIRINDRIIPI